MLWGRLPDKHTQLGVSMKLHSIIFLHRYLHTAPTKRKECLQHVYPWADSSTLVS